VRSTLLLLVLVFALSGCQVLPPMVSALETLVATPADAPTALPPAPTDAPITDAAIQVYFSEPSAATAAAGDGGPDVPLVAAIDAARTSVDLAGLQINLERLAAALIRAQRRGVTVRVVTDSDYLDEDAILEMEEAGIEVLGDRREGLMHDKFVVIDGAEVWTGSMNFTYNGAYRNDNNLLRLRSSELAENYTTEFDEMFVEDLFGPDKYPGTPHPQVTLDGITVATYFSPDDGTAAHLIDLLRGAERSIYFMAFSFTSDDLAQVIEARAKAGVTVAGVMEESQVESNTGGEFANFTRRGLDVRLDGNPRNMHHKVFIIDEQIVVTGSYNFSASAERRNDENTLVIYSPELAAQFLREFKRVQALAAAP
jgi:phosphatidylserine/phosphatidylglycerophosphate/cardiolipin synthase-like enzyme